jgi:DUF1009 family protein
MDGVLIAGVYGTGKSSVAAEIAETLERRGVSYAAIDLDWLTWFDVPGMDRDAATEVYLANVASVAGNLRAAGVRHLVLAVAVRDRLEVIARRLRSDPTSGRRDDLEVAARWLDDSVGAGVEDLALANTGSIPDLADRIIDWLGW